MITIDQLPWNELNGDGSLTCLVEDAYWRGVEENLRQTIYKWTHFPADMVVDPFIPDPQGDKKLRLRHLHIRRGAAHGRDKRHRLPSL